MRAIKAPTMGVLTLQDVVSPAAFDARVSTLREDAMTVKAILYRKGNAVITMSPTVTLSDDGIAFAGQDGFDCHGVLPKRGHPRIERRRRNHVLQSLAVRWWAPLWLAPSHAPAGAGIDLGQKVKVGRVIPTSQR